MKNETTGIALSVVIPVRNNEASLAKLFDRLYPVLDGLGIGYEAVFVDDGSCDRSVTLLRQQYKLRADVTRILLLRCAGGRPAAIAAGFEASTGSRVVTLEPNLRTAPEEIPRFLAELDRGHDCVGSVRRRRRDTGWRNAVFEAIGRLRERITGIRMADPGSIPGAYERKLLDSVLTSDEVPKFVPALACVYAANPVEIESDPVGRAEKMSGCPMYERMRRDLELVTRLSAAPLQIFSVVGIGLSLACFAIFVFLVIGGLVSGPEVEDTSSLFAILFLLVGVILFGIGLLGEYLGRIYERSHSLSSRPVREHLRPKSDSAKTRV